MAKHWIPLALLIATTTLLLLANYFVVSTTILKLAATAFVLAVIYFVFKVLVQEKFIERIKVSERRYYLSKVVFFIYVFSIILAITAIWIENIQAMLLGFGLVAAAFTITMQDVAKNFVGGSSILFNGIYKVGDRIEINSKRGDVLDIGILYTTIMETGEWISGDQHTGRISVIPNGYVLSSTLNNYTRDFNLLWDEVSLPITYESDWRKAQQLILEIVRNKTTPARELADEEINRLEKKYLFTRRSIEPDVFIRPTDNWIELTARYVTLVRQRRTIRSEICQKILEEIEAAPDIRIASATMDVVGFPQLSIRKEKEMPLREGHESVIAQNQDSRNGT
jgi:small-conductance mechanosensitive channel